MTSLFIFIALMLICCIAGYFVSKDSFVQHPEFESLEICTITGVIRRKSKSR